MGIPRILFCRQIEIPTMGHGLDRIQDQIDCQVPNLLGVSFNGRDRPQVSLQIDLLFPRLSQILQNWICS